MVFSPLPSATLPPSPARGEGKAKKHFKLGWFFAVFMVLCVPAFGQEAVEDTEQTTPIDIKPADLASVDKPALSEAGKAFANVPLPPSKPADLLQSTPAPSEEPSTPEKTDEQAEKPAEAVLDAFVPLPPVKPEFNLPLPPSMEPPKLEEKDEEGEEEGLANGIEKQVDSVELACIQPDVMAIVKKAGAFFHAVPIITSGYRARGRRGSMHRLCKAVDFIVPGVSTQVLASYLKSLPEAGGVGTYCHTKSVHVDIGEPRNWGYCGFRRTYFSLR